jgi:hypothetical protein
MSIVRPVRLRPWDYIQQKRDFSQQKLQKPQTALSLDASLEQRLREFNEERGGLGEV